MVFFVLPEKKGEMGYEKGFFFAFLESWYICLASSKSFDIRKQVPNQKGLCGLMDKALGFEHRDCGFESRHDLKVLLSVVFVGFVCYLNYSFSGNYYYFAQNLCFNDKMKNLWTV